MTLHPFICLSKSCFLSRLLSFSFPLDPFSLHVLLRILLILVFSLCLLSHLQYPNHTALIYLQPCLPSSTGRLLPRLYTSINVPLSLWGRLYNLNTSLHLYHYLYNEHTSYNGDQVTIPYLSLSHDTLTW